MKRSTLQLVARKHALSEKEFRRVSKYLRGSQTSAEWDSLSAYEQAASDDMTKMEDRMLSRTYKPVKTNRWSKPWEDTKAKVFDALDEMFNNADTGQPSITATRARAEMRTQFNLTHNIAAVLHTEWSALYFNTKGR